MAMRVPLSAVGVQREGKTVYPPVGKPFNFKDEELKQLTALEKRTGKKLVRKLVVEQGSEAEAQADEAPGADETDLSKLTVKQLTALAAERNVDLDGATAKADILAKLQESEAAGSGEDEL